MEASRKDGAQAHGKDHELGIVREFEPDDRQKIAGSVASEVDDREGTVDGMADGSVVDTVIVGGAVDVHITISQYGKCARRSPDIFIRRWPARSLGAKSGANRHGQLWTRHRHEAFLS